MCINQVASSSRKQQAKKEAEEEDVNKMDTMPQKRPKKIMKPKK